MLACHIVKDLLPSYIDGLLSEETAREVSEHLAGCEDCEALHERLAIPITENPPGGEADKEVNFLKKIKKNTRRIKVVAGIFAAFLLIFGTLTWFLAIGFAVSSEDLTVTTEIQQSLPENNNYLDQEWVIHFNLTNGKALVPWTKYLFAPGEEGNESAAIGCVIELTEVPALNWLHESPGYTYGYSFSGGEPPDKDFRVTVRLKDTQLEYSVTEEGLFEPQFE
jgi:hypothetical protein